MRGLTQGRKALERTPSPPDVRCRARQVRHCRMNTTKHHVATPRSSAIAHTILSRIGAARRIAERAQTSIGIAAPRLAWVQRSVGGCGRVLSRTCSLPFSTTAVAGSEACHFLRVRQLEVSLASGAPKKTEYGRGCPAHGEAALLCIVLSKTLRTLASRHRPSLRFPKAAKRKGFSGSVGLGGRSAMRASGSWARSAVGDRR